ncbi:hypothetical protein PENTCL1PPCAC_13663 [Pristionchus entomophagus]|uniref:Uncharacterized protein n=1 Tax=Pristionchus entomophagus TaxID=358040 RepID=A0AAV5T8C7_9BILA|nr:hypothetical protein PENTCL1PPCAC_13663 [Pristionchus entomophagus]
MDKSTLSEGRIRLKPPFFGEKSRDKIVNGHYYCQLQYIIEHFLSRWYRVARFLCSEDTILSLVILLRSLLLRCTIPKRTHGRIESLCQRMVVKFSRCQFLHLSHLQWQILR